MLYAFDYGVTQYSDVQNAETSVQAYYYDGTTRIDIPNVYMSNKKEFCSTIEKIDKAATKENIEIPSLYYWEVMDAVVLGQAINEAKANPEKLNFDIANLTADKIRTFNADGKDRGILDVFGYVKYFDEGDEAKLWDSYDVISEQVKTIIALEPTKRDDVPTKDYITVYKNSMNSYIANYRSCLTTNSGLYGSYGPQQMPIEIQGKGWFDWKGLLEFLFVWPIGALVDVLTKGFLAISTPSGWAQVAAIFVVTIVVRGLMLLVTFKQTKGNQKMQELQPEITKIQNKYPNATTNQYEKQRMAEEMQRLYKKNKINPLGSLLVMIVQFPVFICVWGAMQGSAYLSTGEFLGLRLSDSIGSVMTSPSAWANGGGATALVLFVLMAAAQTVSMLLPQWIQKAKVKKVAKLGRNPSAKAQSNKMKWFTYIMLFMIIFMGFSLASGMGVYWFVGALISIAQTLITNAISNKKTKKGKR
jgi:YidC/Oxa1 family membrane protein insertase